MTANTAQASAGSAEADGAGFRAPCTTTTTTTTKRASAGRPTATKTSNSSSAAGLPRPSTGSITTDRASSPAAAPATAAHTLAHFDPPPRNEPSPSSSIASLSRTLEVRSEEAPTTANRSRSSSVSAAIKATFHRPSTSSGLPSGGSSPASSTKAKGRLRAGTWKGTGSNRNSTQSSRPELPAFDGSDRMPRASIYGSSQDAEQTETASSPSSSSLASASQVHLAGSEVVGVTTRRKLFGRSNSIRDLAKQVSPEASKEGGHNILRRIGSRSFFVGGSSKDAMRSSESLAASAIIEGSTSSKQADPSRLGPGSAWHRKKGRAKQHSDSDSVYSLSPSISKSSPAGTNSSPPPASAATALPERESIESSRSLLSISTANRAAGTAPAGDEAQPDAHLLAPHSSAAASGLPKRLSGWLLNMMGNEAPSSLFDATAAPGSQQRIDSDRASVRSASKSPSLGNSSPRAASPARELEGLPSNTAAQAVSTGASRAKAGSLLYSFTGGPNKAARSGTAQGSSSGGGAGGVGWVTGGAGFDRALKYFLDTETESEEGIWLLGVWHGPSRDPQPDLQVGLDEEADKAATSSVAGEPCTHGSGGGDARQATAYDPVLTSASVHASLPASSPQAASEDGFVLARNPPTPQTSPVKLRSLKGLSQPSSATNTIRSTSTEQSERSSSPATSAQHGSSQPNPNSDWQATFQADFSSRIWCTYRNNFGPIARDGTISEQAASAAALAAEAEVYAALNPSSTNADKTAHQGTGGNRSWLGRKFTESSLGRDGLTPAAIANAMGGTAGGSGNVNAGLATSPSSLGDKMGITGLWGRATAAAQAAGFSRAGLTTDAGWGCMLRTGQSLLANALIDTHLGRSWTRSPAPIAQAKMIEQGAAAAAAAEGSLSDSEMWRDFYRSRKAYAKYAKLLSWFLDDPSPACPFGVHRMTREGKRLGKEVGEWFGPSTAAGAIQALVNEFPEAGLGVALAHDGSVYLDEVRAAALNRTAASRMRSSQSWQRPVLILIGIRLGLEGVNPMYYDSVKATFSFPQSVGISGGRPSSSYYFMGHQGNSLFYLDPHHVRPAVPLRYPPARFPAATPSPDECSLVDNEEEWWAHAYTEPQLATFHCDKVRRMPIKSLDPSMLLGFLCKDEADLQDLCARVKAMPKAIFAFADSAPRWADDDDFDPSMESFSESSLGDPEDDRDAEGDNEDHDISGGPVALTSGSDRSQDAVVISPSATAAFPAEPRAKLIGHGRPSHAAAAAAAERGMGMLAFPSVERPALSHSDRSNTFRPDSESRHVSGSSEATTCARPRTRTGTGARRVSNNMLAARSSRQAPSPVAAGNESFSTISFSDSEVGSAWEEISEGGTVAGGEGRSSAEPSEDAAQPTDQLPPMPSPRRASSDLVDVALDAPTEERNRPVLVPSSPSGYAVNGAPLSVAAQRRQRQPQAQAQDHDRESSTAHAPLRDLPRRRSRLDRSPRLDNHEASTTTSPEDIPPPPKEISTPSCA